jgi:hypothetical protein
MFSLILSKSNRFYAIHIVSFELELTSYFAEESFREQVSLFPQ